MTPEDVGDFAGGSILLSGVDPLEQTAKLRQGDEVLLGVRLLNGDTRRTWYVRVVAGEPESETGDNLLLHVYVHDERARLLAEDRVTVTGFLAEGALRACVENPTPGRSPTFFFGQGQGDVGTAAFVMMDVVRVIEETDVLADILWAVVRRPSVFSLISGARVSAGMSFDHARPVQNPIGSQRAYAFPFKVMMNSEAALLCTVTVTESWSPLRVCGGVVELVGHAPDDSNRRVIMRLLAARRGPGSH